MSLEYLTPPGCDAHSFVIVTELLRKELNPLALDSYLEAYAELKQCLLVLVVNSKQADTLGSELWSLHSRNSLAGRLARTVRQYHGESFAQTEQFTLCN